MRIEVLLTPDCRHAVEALVRLRSALEMMGLHDATFTCRTISKPSEAIAADFRGSPGYYVDGRDIFPGDGAPTLGCRTFVDGTLALPTVGHLRDALQSCDPL
ncbi:hypothetical protein KDK95_30495 [Actinospica sp. MGRD01-02]|uniref:Thioredoxin family protein n=1 Tax=Actinospica acidithermotolerans TaxID=2828514 RepID=A0A941EFT9_9ACTN|nr:hypothetical protein [Actinospica acidithermotolerans]MBR7830671.1 hypothetical protein [Actinospica acidithermotolerans]